MMPASVQSLDDYALFIRQVLEPRPPLAVFAFCVWCIERFEPEFDELIWDGLTPAEQQRTSEIIIELQDHARRGALVPTERATILQAELESFGPQGDDIYESYRFNG